VVRTGYFRDLTPSLLDSHVLLLTSPSYNEALKAGGLGREPRERNGARFGVKTAVCCASRRLSDASSGYLWLSSATSYHEKHLSFARLRIVTDVIETPSVWDPTLAGGVNLEARGEGGIVSEACHPLACKLILRSSHDFPFHLFEGLLCIPARPTQSPGRSHRTAFLDGKNLGQLALALEGSCGTRGANSHWNWFAFPLPAGMLLHKMKKYPGDHDPSGAIAPYPVSMMWYA
jgi:hypothetical protein